MKRRLLLFLKAIESIKTFKRISPIQHIIRVLAIYNIKLYHEPSESQLVHIVFLQLKLITLHQLLHLTSCFITHWKSTRIVQSSIRYHYISITYYRTLHISNSYRSLTSLQPTKLVLISTINKTILLTILYKATKYSITLLLVKLLLRITYYLLLFLLLLNHYQDMLPFTYSLVETPWTKLRLTTSQQQLQWLQLSLLHLLEIVT